jgi:hypothetical protein
VSFGLIEIEIGRCILKKPRSKKEKTQDDITTVLDFVANEVYDSIAKHNQQPTLVENDTPLYFCPPLNLRIVPEEQGVIVEVWAELHYPAGAEPLGMLSSEYVDSLRKKLNEYLKDASKISYPIEVTKLNLPERYFVVPSHQLQ